MSNKTLELRSRSIGFPAASCSTLFSTFYLVFRPAWKAAGRGNVHATRYVVSRTFPRRKRGGERTSEKGKKKNLRDATARA